MRQTHFKICRVCEQRPAYGRDPVTGRTWKQCGCLPTPASMRRTKAGIVAVTADPTEEELEALYGSRPVDDSLQEVDREIAERLAGLTRENHPYPIVGIECNGRVIPYTIECFLPVPLSHTPHNEPTGRAEAHRLGRQAEATASVGMARARRNTEGS